MRMYIFAVLLMSRCCYGEVVMYSKEPLELSVSRDFNRIGFKYSQIKEIVGNKNKCSFNELSNGEMSFFPAAKFGTRLEFGLITNTGVVQDVVFTVRDIPPQNFIIDVPLPHENMKTINDIDNIDIFMKRVLSGRMQFNPVDGSWKRYDIVKLRASGFLTEGGLIARVFDVMNIKRKPIDISEDTFRLIFHDHLSIYVADNKLLPYKKAQILVVSKI